MAVPGLRRRALIDLAAFADDLRADPPAVLDLRADAYGHGITVIAPVARELGVTRVRVTDAAEADAARAAGFADPLVGRDPDPGDAPAESAYGVGGGRPVMTLVGELVAVKHVPGGAGVSYGYTHRTTAATWLGLVGLGYADGVPRLASNRASVAVGGERRPLVGRIAMDQFVVDLGAAPAGIGSDVVLFGDPARGEPSLAEWAEWTERSPLALTAGLGPRIRREAR